MSLYVPNGIESEDESFYEVPESAPDMGSRKPSFLMETNPSTVSASADASSAPPVGSAHAAAPVSSADALIAARMNRMRAKASIHPHASAERSTYDRASDVPESGHISPQGPRGSRPSTATTTQLAAAHAAAGSTAASGAGAGAETGTGYRTAPAGVLSAATANAAGAAGAGDMMSPPSHTSAGSAAAAAAGANGADPEAKDDMRVVIRDLDTGATFLADDVAVNASVERQASARGRVLPAPASGPAAARVGATSPSASSSGSAPAAGSAPAGEADTSSASRGFWARFRRQPAASTAAVSASGSNAGAEGKRVKVRVKRKNTKELSALTARQQVAFHAGPVWSLKWSPCGSFLATAGHDGVVAVWAVAGTPAAAEIAARGSDGEAAASLAAAAEAQAAVVSASAAAAAAAGPVSPRNRGASGSGSGSAAGAEEPSASASNPASAGSNGMPRSTSASGSGSGSQVSGSATAAAATGAPAPVIYPVPYMVWVGHKADVVDLSWSAGLFLLSASIDKTVRLWHVSRPKSILVFQHTDVVTSVAFHPVDDRYFLSGSFDKRLRIWSIPQHRVVEWAHAPAIITAVAFSPDGTDAVAGLVQGQVSVYWTDQLTPRMQIDCKNRSGKFSSGRKVTGLEFSANGHYLLVTTNDSRIRLINFSDFSLESKYKGLTNEELQLRASFSPNGSRIVCGSEDGQCFIWSTLTGANGQDNHIDAYESFPLTSSKDSITATAAMFVPFESLRASAASAADLRAITHVFVATGFDGVIRFFENKAPPAKV